MASRLLASGHDLLVHDLDPAKTAEMVSQGAAAASPRDMAAHAATIFTCVFDGHSLEQLLFGPGGLTSAASAETLLVDHTSTDPDECRTLADRARSVCGLRMVDAPISGGPAAAVEGKLVAWLGGDAEDVERITPLIANYAMKAIHVGTIGQGQLSKSCNQFIVASTIALWSQMLRYAESCGLDPSRLIGALEGGAADSAIGRLFSRQIVEGKVPHASIRNQMKDLRIILGHEGGADGWPLAQAALQEFELHIARRNGHTHGSPRALRASEG
jgi:3-hydroxyisobutyrate dehydrogenase